MKERANPWAKRFDFYLGVPLVFILGFFKLGHKSAPQNPKQIALLKSSAIGDTVLISSIVRDLHKKFPEAAITVFTGKSNFRAAQLLIAEAQIEVLPMFQPWKALQIIRQKHFDVFIDFDSWPRINAILTYFSNSNFKIGFSTRGQMRDRVYDRSLDHSWNIHEIENYRNLVRPLGVTDFSNPRLQLVSSNSVKKQGASSVIFHPWPGGSRAREKMWAPEKWMELARIWKRNGFEILISTGPGDVKKSQDLVREGGNDLWKIAAPESLEKLIELLAQASAVVTVDTGVAHLAGALGQRTIVLHGPTSPSRWGAIGSRVRTLKDAQEATIQLGFEAPLDESVQLSVEEVSRELEELLKS